MNKISNIKRSRYNLPLTKDGREQKRANRKKRNNINKKIVRRKKNE